VHWTSIGSRRRAWVTLRPESFFIVLGAGCFADRLVEDMTRKHLVAPSSVRIQKTDLTQDFTRSFICDKQTMFKIRGALELLFQGLPVAFKRKLGLRQRVIVKVKPDSFRSCLYLVVRILDSYDVVADLIQVKVYCKTIEIMSRKYSFLQVGGRYQELLHFDLGKNKPLESALRKTQDIGLTRVELSFYKLNLVTAGNRGVSSGLIDKIKQILNVGIFKKKYF
jgi:hypothetical protein